MYQYRNLTKFIVGTLAMKLAGLDDDGLDLRFTIGENVDIENKTEKDNASAIFEREIDKQFHGNYETDMASTLDRIFKKYGNGPIEKKMTVLVITDGIWDELPREGHADRVERKLNDFLGPLQKRKNYTERCFTIQFIRIGDDKAAISRLKRLDDEMEGLP